MAKIGNPNQRSKYKALNARLARYVVLVQQMYDAYNLEAAKLATSVNYGMEKPFRFSDFPTTTKRLDDILTNWRRDLSAIITTGTAKEWGNSNLTQDMLADKALAYYYGKSHGRRVRRYYQKNSDALKAFQTRVDNGMNLSQKIWDQSRNYKTELEAAVSAGIQKGMSAVTLSKRVSKYLNDFDQLKKDYKERYGREVDCLNCEYRSIRLARSEINMAYRTAEQERWKQFDFVLGYEIKLSQQHETHMPHGDICDDLKGKYPKDFKWTGWHPNDMCYAVPILKTEEEFFSDEPSDREVTDVPDAMKKWVIDNHERLEEAERRGTSPYWVRDNKVVMDEERITQYNANRLTNIIVSLVGGEPVGDALSINDTCTVLDRIVSENKGWVKGKFDGFEADVIKHEDAFMRQEYWRESSTGVVHHKIHIVGRKFMVKDADGKITTFNPLNSVREALAAIVNGNPLTFNQEYAIESVWHEILHCGAVGWKNKDLASESQTIAAEVINQYCARRSYRRLLGRLGGKPLHYDGVLKKGYGYQTELENLGKILSHYKISEDEFYDYFKGKINAFHYEDMFDMCVKYLEMKGVKNATDLLSNAGRRYYVSRMLDSPPK